jgi:hypothetical protein
VNERDRKALAKALAVLRDPDGTGRTKVSAGFGDEPMRCLKCHLPTAKQKPNIVVPDGPRCSC